MHWCRQYAATIIILTSLFLCFWHLKEKINAIDKELAIIKTVLVMKTILPNDLAKSYTFTPEKE